MTVEKNREGIVLEVTRARAYRLLREYLRDRVLSEEPFIENNGGEIVVGYKIRIRNEEIGGIVDLYDYLAGCIDAGLETVEKNRDRIILRLRCGEPSILGKQGTTSLNGYVIIEFNEREFLDNILPRLRDKYVVRRIKAIVSGDQAEYHRVVREESQADEVLRQLAVEEILFSNRREEYEKILSIKPEEAKFQQKMLKELIGCGR